MSYSKERLLTWLMTIMLTCVLIGLALLQYRWSSEISQAENMRIQSALQTSMMSFREDLSRDLGTLCLEFQGVPSVSASDANEMTQKVLDRQKSIAFPRLTSNVYFWSAHENGGRTLLRLTNEGRFESIAWPPQLQRLQQVLSSFPLDQPQDLHPLPALSTGHPAILGPALTVGGIDQSIPVLAVPTKSSHSRPAWLLVELNLQVLEGQLLPQLATRHFGDAGTSDYEVAVVATGEKRQVIYTSDPDFLKTGDINGDASVNLFGPPEPRSGAFHPPFEPFRPSGDRFSGPGNNKMDSGPIRFDPIRYGNDDADWRIIVRHREGSVAAVVAKLRIRNLALSFGVLLVLAASMALVIFTSARAKRLAALQMDFVAGVSHELRTPVAAILSISDNIASGIVNDKPQFVAYGDLIRHQARQLNHLIEQVLRFSATRRKASNYRLFPVQISDIIDEALKNTAVLIDASAVEVHRTIEPGLPVVHADANALSQCLQNLITNAVKYGGGGRWIGICVTRGEANRVSEVMITVADHGIGISPEFLSHVFDPFYRSPQVAESEVHGTGLGLAIAKSVVEAMGGRISVKSEVGKGAAFTVHLPVKGAQFQPANEAGES
jgi:signal transduction histidine kinase